MINWTLLIAALFAVVFGGIKIMTAKPPLFFKILWCAFGCFLLGQCFAMCYELVTGNEPSGFNVGHFGFIGMYAFLFSAYFGAMNRLGDSGEPHFRKYRTVSLISLFVLFFMYYFYINAPINISHKINISILVIPIVLLSYFALKFLILPDVDLGIIKVMRPFSAIMLYFCIAHIGFEALAAYNVTYTYFIGKMSDAAVIAVTLPVAYRGVKKWFM